MTAYSSDATDDRGHGRMGCERCDPFDAEVPIGTRAVLRSVAERVRQAIRTGTLCYNSFESSRESIGQRPFLDLDLAGVLPDVLRYHFDCENCGNCYGLFVETFDGTRGRWFLTGRSPANKTARKTRS
jgi:hypothetical protein